MADEATKVTLELSKDEAIVLFELSSRFSQTDELGIEDEAEERVLCNLSCLLEEILLEPFKPNYDDLLARSRQRLKSS